MKRYLSVILAVLLLVGCLSGCGAKKEAEGDHLARIQAKGELVVAMEGTWTPWSFHDESDALVGFDADVARAIGEKLGVKVTIIEGEWDGLLAGLDGGRYDMVVNGIEVDEEREKKYDFADPYCYIRTALIVRSDNEDITCFEDLNGKATANSIASTYMTLAESYGASATGVDTLDQTIELVLAGRVDATLNAEVSYYDYLSVHPEAEIKIVDLTEEASHVAIPLCKGEDNASLLAAVNKAIGELSEDGTLAELSIKYFGSDMSKAE